MAKAQSLLSIIMHSVKLFSVPLHCTPLVLLPVVPWGIAIFSAPKNSKNYLSALILKI